MYTIVDKNLERVDDTLIYPCLYLAMEARHRVEDRKAIIVDEDMLPMTEKLPIYRGKKVVHDASDDYISNKQATKLRRF